MAELTTSQLIKIIIGIFVVVIVVLGIFLFFRGSVIDFFKNLIGDEEEKIDEVPSEIGQESGENFDLKAGCEASDCTTQPSEDLKCSILYNVIGYGYKCTRKGCVRRSIRTAVENCDYGCTDGECNSDCLPTGTIVYFIHSKTRPNRDWCCNGYSCLERGFLWRCKGYKCN